jgi:hypothetical protein
MLEKIKISNLIIISKNLLELNIFINLFLSNSQHNKS